MCPIRCDRAQGFPRTGAHGTRFFSRRGPSPALGPHVGYLVAFWTVCTQQAATSPSLV